MDSPYQQLADDSQLKRNFGDSLERIKWRSKQALDFASVMKEAVRVDRAQEGGVPLYMQLEDDVIASPAFVSRVLARVADAEGRGERWSMLSFYCPHRVPDWHRLDPGQFFGFISSTQKR